MILANDNLHDHGRQRGVLRVFTQTVAALSEGFEVTICSPRRYPELRTRQIILPRPPGRRAGRLYNLLAVHDRLVSLIAARERPAVIYNPYYGAVRARAAQVYTVHDLIVERFPDYFPRERPGVRMQLAQKRRCFERAALLLANSATTAHDLRAAYPQVDPARIVTIPLGVEEVFFGAPRPIGAPRPYFLFAGNRDRYKNFPALVRAYGASGLAERYDLRVFSPGSPELSPEEQGLAERSGLAGRVLVGAAPSDEEARDLYASAAALVYPSLYEGFGFPVLEAMASGTLVAASTGGALPEVGGEEAFYFDPYSIEALAATLRTIAELDETARRARVARGRERAGQYSWSSYRRRVREAVGGVVAMV